MGNCLVTKLAGVIDNDDLLELGYVRAEIYNIDQLLFNYKNTEFASKVKLIGFNVNGQTVFNLSVNDFCYIKPEDITVTAPKQYIEFYKYGTLDTTHGYMNQVLVDYKDLQYLKFYRPPFDKSQAAGSTQRVSGYGDIKYLIESIKNYNLEHTPAPTPFDVAYAFLSDAVYGDVTPIGRDFDVSVVSINRATNSNLVGTLDNVGYSAGNLSQITFPQTKTVKFSSENFVKKARKMGVTTKSGFTFYYIDKVDSTFNGSPITEAKELSWTATTITYGDVTIQNSDVEP